MSESIIVKNWAGVISAAVIWMAAQTAFAADIEVGIPNYGGTGCPQGSASATLSPDRKALSVLFDRFIVAAGGSTGLGQDYKNCDLAVPVRVPPGITVAVFSVDYRGFTSLPAGGRARFSADYFFAGKQGSVFTRDFSGPLAEDYVFNAPTQGTVWSACGESVILRARTMMQVATNSRRDEAQATVDSADLSAGITYKIEARPCGVAPTPPPAPGTIRYEAERDLQHRIGYAEGDGWVANTHDHDAGHLIYGPYSRDWTTGPKVAKFRMLVDNNTADNGLVATLDVFDATAGQRVGYRELRRREFAAPYVYKDFDIDFDMTGREGHAMEVRVLWHDISYMKVDAVTIANGANLPPPLPPVSIRYEAEKDLQHRIGYVDGDGWAVNTVDQDAGFMVYGPYATNWGAGPKSAAFRMLVDNNSADDLTILVIDVNDATTGEVLARREVRRTEFSAPFAYQDFTLDFDMTGREGHAMETRVYSLDYSYIRVDSVAIQNR